MDLGSKSSVELAGFTLDGASSTFASQGIAGGGGKSEYLHDLRVQNLVKNSDFGPHGVYFDDVTDNRIVNNEFVNIGVDSAWGAGIRLSHGSSRSVVTDNTVRDTGRGGILVNDDTTDVVIRDNTVTGSGQSPEGLGLGIEIYGHSDRALVEGNHVDHWLSVSASDQAAVRNNVVSSQVGPVKFAGLELAADSADSLFVGNTVNGGAQIGISISGDGLTQRALFSHNTIQDSQTWGVQLQGDAGGAQQMVFYDNTITGSVEGSGNLYPNQGNAFRFNGNATDIVLDSNRLIDNDNIGLQLGTETADQLAILNNTITGNGGPAVTRDYDNVGSFLGHDLQWSNNTVTGNGNNYQMSSVGFANSVAPTVEIVVPPMATVGKDVAFSFTFADDGTRSHVLWDFGEGLPNTAASPMHAYTAPGDYRVAVVVWDNDGRAGYDEFMLHVVPEPPSLGLGAIGALPLVAVIFRGRNGRAHDRLKKP